MKAAAMSVWIFINLLCFGMCGYLYLIWSQYWMTIEKQRLFNKSDGPQKTVASGISSYHEHNYNTALNNTALDLSHKSRRSVINFRSSGQLMQTSNKSSGTQVRPSNTVVRKIHGSPRFPNTHKPLLNFDSDKYVCADFTTSDCAAKSTEFKELLLKEFHRVLMSDSKVFTSGLDSQNPYDVKYEKGSAKQLTRKDVLCALGGVKVRTVTAEDEPFSRLGYNIPKFPLQQNRNFDTCAVVTSAGALLGSRLGEFIDHSQQQNSVPTGYNLVNNDYSHDMVLRFNNAPTDNYTDDVGSKTTIRVLNSQVVTKPEFRFLEDPLYQGVSILIWDPSNYSATLEDWYKHPDFPLFPVYKKLLQNWPSPDIHLLNPHVLWDLWAVLQDSSLYRLRRNPPSSGFIGLWFALQRCRRVRMFEYVPSVRLTRRCHYHVSRNDTGCTLGAWHPLAQEKAIAERIRDNSDLDVFQRGFIDVPGIKSFKC